MGGPDDQNRVNLQLSQFVNLFDTTVDNQRQLLATAQDIRAFLRESD